MRRAYQMLASNRSENIKFSAHRVSSDQARLGDWGGSVCLFQLAIPHLEDPRHESFVKLVPDK